MYVCIYIYIYLFMWGGHMCMCVYANPCVRVGQVYRVLRRDSCWQAAQNGTNLRSFCQEHGRLPCTCRLQRTGAPYVGGHGALDSCIYIYICICICICNIYICSDSHSFRLLYFAPVSGQSIAGEISATVVVNADCACCRAAADCWTYDFEL